MNLPTPEEEPESYLDYKKRVFDDRQKKLLSLLSGIDDLSLDQYDKCVLKWDLYDIIHDHVDNMR